MISDNKLTKKSFFSGSVIYLIANISSASIPFLLLPILTRYLKPTEYGEIAIFLAILSALPAFVGLNVAGAANRKFFDTEIPDSGKTHFNAACMQILLVSGTFTAIVVYVFRKKISDLIEIRESWLMWAILVSASVIVINILLGQWQVRQQAIKYGALQIARSALTVAFSLALVIGLQQGAEGRIAAHIIVTLSFAVLAIVFLLHEKLLLVLSFQPKYIFEALQFGVPLIPHTIGGFLLLAFDRVIIGSTLGLAEAGVYMVAVQLSGAMAIVFDAINKAYVPWLFQRLAMNSIEQDQKVVSYTYVGYVMIVLVAVVAFLIGPKLISVVAGPNYQDAGYVLGWMILGQGFSGMYLSVTNYIFYAKKTGMLSFATITTGFVHVLLVYYFVTALGLVGAGIAFSVSMGLRFLFTWWIAQRVYPMPWFRYQKR